MSVNRKPSTKTTRDILRLPQITNGLTFVHANICDGDLDFSHSPSVADNIQDALSELTDEPWGSSSETESQDSQLRVWRDECESIERFVEREVAQLTELEQRIEESARTASQQQGEQLEELRRAERKSEEIGNEIRRIEQRIEDQSKELSELQHLLRESESVDIVAPRDDASTRHLIARLDQLDRRILKWRKKQREISQQIVRHRESMVTGTVAQYPAVSQVLEDVRRRLLRLEKSAEDLVGVVQTNLTSKSKSRRDDVEDEFDTFKKDLESAYNGLHDVHTQASRRISELERERAEWNLRTLRRQVREIERTIQKLLEQRADALAELTKIYPNQQWLTYRAQTGYCYCATSHESARDCDSQSCNQFDRDRDSYASKSVPVSTSGTDVNLRARIAQLRSILEQDQHRRVQLHTELESTSALCARLQRVVDQIKASENDTHLLEQASDSRIKIREAQSHLVALRRRISEYDGKKVAKLYRVLDQASAHLAKFSGGSLRAISFNRGTQQLDVHDSHGTEHNVAALSDRNQALVYLCVSIELLEYWTSRQQHASWNLAIDSLAPTTAEECAVVLNDHCPHDFKLIVSTKIQDIADRLSWRGLRVLRFELPPTIAPASTPPPKERPPVEPRRIIMRSNNSDAEEFPGEFRDQVVRDTSRAPLTRIYHEALTEAYDSAHLQLERLEGVLDDYKGPASSISEPADELLAYGRLARNQLGDTAKNKALDSPDDLARNPSATWRNQDIDRDSRVRDLGIIPEAALHRLESEGVILVRDLLAWPPERLAQHLQVREASSASIAKWQRHAELRYQIPKLTRFDASVLIACDVDTADKLRRLEGFELADRIENLRRTNAGQKLIRSGSDDELAKLNAWILNMQESKRLQRFGYTDSSEVSNSNSPNDTSHIQIHEKLKFYLDLDSEVEAAPAIGARMAEHLARIQVHTVRDLLNGSPSEIARKLDHSRVNPNVVSTWQRQAALVCSIPNLRGHDAQLLVSCEVDSPQALASYKPDSLFAIVGPFSKTRDGAKIIRGGKLPDISEVRDWIRWAQHHRTIKAA